MFRLKTSEELVIFVNFDRVAHIYYDKNIKKTKINYEGNKSILYDDPDKELWDALQAFIKDQLKHTES